MIRPGMRIDPANRSHIAASNFHRGVMTPLALHIALVCGFPEQKTLCLVQLLI